MFVSSIFHSLVISAVAILSASDSFADGAKSCRTVFSSSAPATSTRFWSDFDRTFDAVVSGNISKSNAHYRQALEDQHPYAVFLARAGIRMNSQAQVPAFADFVKNFEGSVFKPAFVFSDRRGRLHYLEHGSIVTEGYKLHKSLLANAQFFAMLAEGYFPLGSFETEIDDRIALSSLEHDLAHLFVLKENKKFAENVRQLAVQINRSDVNLDDLQNFGAISNRIFMALEMATLFPSHARSTLVESGLLPAEFSSIRYEQSHFSRVATHLNLNRANTEFDSLLEKLPSMLRYLGGGSADILSSKRVHFSSSHQSYLSTPLELIEILRHPSAHDIQKDSPAYIELQSKLLVYLWESSWIEPNEWLSEASLPNLGPSSSLKRLFCFSGFLRSGTTYYNAHCGG